MPAAPAIMPAHGCWDACSRWPVPCTNPVRWGLWITLDAGVFGRLSPTQLTVSSGAGAPTTPERVIPASGLGSGEDIALFPAPAALPLYSALP